MVCFEGRWRDRRFFLTTLLLFGFLSVCPGFYFRGHYFIQMIPSVALLAGAALSFMRHWTSKLLSPPGSWIAWGCAYALFLGGSFYGNQWAWFEWTPTEAAHNIYAGNPFSETQIVAEYLRTKFQPAATIAVLGSEPQIYFLAHRRSATGYIYTYGLMESQSYAAMMQKEMIAEIETARPSYIIYVENNLSWLQNERSDKTIFAWWERYRRAHYQLVGVADQTSPTQTEYRWGAAAAGYIPNGIGNLQVYKQTD